MTTKESAMTDLEITRLCAEAMELAVEMQLGQWRFPDTPFEHSLYDPLHDDAQAMALVKKFQLTVFWWCEGVTVAHGGAGDQPLREWLKMQPSFRGYPDADLNRAICECVAKLHKGVRDG